MDDSLLQQKIYKAVKYLSKNTGLKIAYSKESPIGIGWKYLKLENNTLKFEDCLK